MVPKDILQGPSFLNLQKKDVWRLVNSQIHPTKTFLAEAILNQ